MATYDSSPGSGNSTAWEARADVIYHYYAYHFFDKSGIDLVNLDEADRDFFNRIGQITKALKTEQKLVDYLSTPHAVKLSKHYPGQVVGADSANTYRRRFIHHVRAYNMTEADRHRVYMINLKDDDIEFLRELARESGGDVTGKELALAHDGLLSTSTTHDSVTDIVEKAIEKFRAEHPFEEKAENKVHEERVAALKLSFCPELDN